ncbi:MAG: hypothetical protein Fur0021_23910 [Candidatus Promineifilaceae bacterium]
MSFDYWATHTFVHEYDNAQKQVIDYLLSGNGHLPLTSATIANITDLAARLHLLAQAIVTDLKDVARAGSPRQPGGLLHLLSGNQVNDYLAQVKETLAALHLLPALPDLTLLPIGSFALHFTFTLASPYLSKDDIALHLLDNPVKKEWVFKLPYVASTQWKGVLEATMVRQLVEWWQSLDQSQQQQQKQRKQFVAQRVQLTRLFGTEIENVQQYLAQCGDEKLNKWHKRYVRRFLSNTGFLAGRLYFYPSFFDQLSLEVINPHNRETGAGSLPIYFEAVPRGASGSFTLLYAPLDCIGQSETETRQQIFADLQLVAQGLEAMFTHYGFGAKTSSGFGLAELAGEGRFAIHYPNAKSQAPRPQEPLYPKEVREFLESYPAEYLDMKPKQLKDAGVPNRLRQQAKVIKDLYLQYQDTLALYQNALATWEAAEATPAPPTTVRGFSTFSDLADILPSPIGDA